MDVYALRGGTGIDSVFQLGVAHAHIVAKLPPPALIVGHSTGAVHAAAIAEILQAPAELGATGDGQRDASLHRFREILYAYQDFAIDLQGAALPDAFEADAGRPLQPNPQAIHFDAERDGRKEALKARSGLIALFNDLFSQSMTVRTMTLVTRAVAGWIATAELPPKLRRRARLRETWYLGKAFLAAPGQCLRLMNDLLRAFVGGTARLAREILDSVDSWSPLIVQRTLTLLEGRHARGYTAGEIVFSAGKPRLALNAFLLTISTAGLVALYVIGTTLLYRAGMDLAFVILVVLGALFSMLVIHDTFKVNQRLRGVSFFDRVLAYYDLQRDLGSGYLIEDLFIRIFDPTYHGKLDMAKVVDRAMRHVDRTGGSDTDQADPEPNPRLFGAYASAKPSIRVVPVVANLQTGQMTKVHASEPIVDGLKAAVSRIPFLPPVQLKTEEEKPAHQRTYYVDAANISSDAAVSALDVLRLDLHPKAESVRLFSVSAITPREPPSADGPHLFEGTVDVALHAMGLARFRDFGDERELILSYNDLIPDEPRAPETVLTPSQPQALRCFGMTDGEPIHFVKSKLIDIQPREALHTTGRLLREKDKEGRQAIIAKAVAEGCRATLAARFGKDGSCRAIIGRYTETPGATEVCRHCLHFTPERSPANRSIETVEAPSIPQQTSRQHTKEPTINLLFSGGVFRGVFQIGVLNALSQLDVKPNVIAGSSVGSIVAAMIARVFTFSDADRRNVEVAKLAATFLTLDRLIITDRFADFVRRFTLRAAAARFSLRDTDFFFRNYGRVSTEFDAVARRVVAGIEHLFYVSPYELSDLVREIRQQNYSEAYDLACRYAQEICDRGTVGFEILGAEPLALLIKQHVLEEHQRDRRAHGVPLTDIASNIVFLLTATNFTTRELKIIGSKPQERPAALLEALLASSAFPGVFRPRWAREIFFGDNSLHQYIDGGVLDNLPLGPVVDHMFRAAERLEIEFRPSRNRPHLILTASLEPETSTLQGIAAERVGHSWLAARKRAKWLRYNQKIDRFRKAQRDLRYLVDQYSTIRGTPVGADTLDIEVVIVKPRWLCGTFAFHPMLGFRRRNQAASIAHGCAATFQTISRIVLSEGTKADGDPHWPADAWKMKTAGIVFEDAKNLEPRCTPQRLKEGRCHFRQDAPCPFSMAVLEKDSTLSDAVRKEIAMIHELCGEKSTHEHAPA